MTDFQALIPFELLRYGIEQSNDTEQLIDLLSGMSETQVNMVKDFITLLRKYN